MSESDSISSLNRDDFLFEIDYLNKLSVTHKSIMLLFMRDRNRFVCNI